MTKISLVLLMTFTGLGISAQTVSDSAAMRFNPLTSSILLSNTDILTTLHIKTDKVDAVSPTERSVMLRQQSLLPTAFFCKLEHRFDKSSRVPLRFRLGDIDYTDAIEGKNRYDVSTFTADQRRKD